MEVYGHAIFKYNGRIPLVPQCASKKPTSSSTFSTACFEGQLNVPLSVLFYFRFFSPRLKILSFYHDLLYGSPTAFYLKVGFYFFILGDFITFAPEIHTIKEET